MNQIQRYDEPVDFKPQRYVPPRVLAARNALPPALARKEAPTTIDAVEVATAQPSVTACVALASGVIGLAIVTGFSILAGAVKPTPTPTPTSSPQEPKVVVVPVPMPSPIEPQAPADNYQQSCQTDCSVFKLF